MSTISKFSVAYTQTLPKFCKSNEKRIATLAYEKLKIGEEKKADSDAPLPNPFTNNYSVQPTNKRPNFNSMLFTPHRIHKTTSHHSSREPSCIINPTGSDMPQ